MNMVYFCNLDLFEEELLSLNKKIFSQLKVFADNGYIPYIIYKDKFRCYILNYLENRVESFFYNGKENMYETILNMCLNLKLKYIYIRHSVLDYFLWEFYRKLKEKNKNSKMVLEFPTIPYDGELKDKTLLNILEIDKFYRSELKTIFDISINFNGLNSVFGVKSIAINNGISLDNISLIKNNKNKVKNKINLIGVSSLSEWNGYDRLVEGLATYYREKYLEYEYIVNINIVGTGPSFKYLQDITIKNKMEEYIKFFGLLNGSVLDNIFENSDIGVGSLGFYSIGLNNGSPLKTKEYCARGLPFIIGYDDLAFDNNCDYIMKVENNNKPIDIYSVIKFYKKIENIDNLSSTMRRYAEDNLTWNKCFEKLFKGV